MTFKFTGIKTFPRTSQEEPGAGPRAGDRHLPFSGKAGFQPEVPQLLQGPRAAEIATQGNNPLKCEVRSYNPSYCGELGEGGVLGRASTHVQPEQFMC